jgi:undecaprenyl-phosphate galactose phosphotransferase
MVSPSSISFAPHQHVQAVDYFSLRKRLLCAIVLICSDLGAIMLVYVSCGLFSQQDSLISKLWVFLGLLFSYFTLSTALGHYFKRLPYWDEYRHLGLFCIAGALIQGIITANLVPSLVFWGGLLLMVPIMRLIGRELLRWAGVWTIPTIILGSGPNARSAAKALFREKYLGYEVMSFLTLDGELKSSCVINGRSIPVRTLSGRLDVFLRRIGNPCVIIAVEEAEVDKLSGPLSGLGFNYPSLLVPTQLKELASSADVGSKHLMVHEYIMLDIRTKLSRLASRFFKRSFDVLGALALIVVLSPVFVVVACLVRRSGKQIIFAHERVGRNGKYFGCLKFRSMVPNAQQALEALLESDLNAREEWEREFKLKNDPRITPIGDFLRKTSLDELPQLWNVLKGEMSLVGPRPVIQDEIERYGVSAAYYFKAKPGLTGLWQVSGRNDIDYDSRIDLDVWYVQNWSMLKDVIILFRTIKVVLGRGGAY